MGLAPVQKAIVVTAPQKAELVTDRALPVLRDQHIFVKVVCVALNPADWKYVDFFSSPGALLGYDYSGIVEEIGKGVTRFAKGDHICGVVHGGNDFQFEDGAFAEYIVVKEHLQIQKPKSLTFREASSIGTGITTVGLSLYQYLKIDLPDDPITEPIPILIYGGSTATGSLAIQFAKLSGYRVITTCSPHNFDFVKRLGADFVCDYKDPGAADEIQRLTNDDLKIVLDTVSLETSAKFCDSAMSTTGGAYTFLLPVAVPRDNVKSDLMLAYTAFGGDFRLWQTFPAVPEDQRFAARWWLLAEKYLSTGQVKVHPVSLREGGLEAIPPGLDLMRKDGVSGQKLVYDVSRAPSTSKFWLALKSILSLGYY